MAIEQGVSQAQINDPANRDKVLRATSLILAGKAGAVRGDPVLQPYVNTLSAMGVRSLQNLSVRLGQEKALALADEEKRLREATITELPAVTQEPKQAPQMEEQATVKGSKKLFYKPPKKIEPPTKISYTEVVVSQEEYAQRIKDQKFETMTVTDLPAKTFDMRNVVQFKPPTFREKAGAFFTKVKVTAPKLPIEIGTVTGYSDDTGIKYKSPTIPYTIDVFPLLLYGAGATPTTIIKTPVIAGVTYAGVTQKVGSAGIRTELQFATTKGFKGRAIGFTKTETAGGKLILGDTSVVGGMGKPALQIPTGKIKWIDPKLFFTEERGLTFSQKLVRDLDIGKVKTMHEGSITGSKGQVVTIGKPPRFSPTFAKIGKADVPVNLEEFKAISLGLKKEGDIVGFGLAKTDRGYSFSTGLLRDLSKTKPPKIQYVSEIETAGGGTQSSKLIGDQIIKDLALQQTKIGVLAGTAPKIITDPLGSSSFVRSLAGFTGTGITQTGKTTQLYSKTFTPPKSITFTIPKVKTVTKVDTKQAPAIITRTGGGLQSKTLTKAITIPKPKTIIKTDIKVATAVTPKSITRLRPTTITKTTGYTSTPTIAFPTPTPITRVPIIPFFPKPFMDRGKGSGTIKGGFGSTYKPSFSALKFNLFGRKPMKKVFTGLELRPIPNGFKWYKRKKKGLLF